jgi:hypothetical protein
VTNFPSTNFYGIFKVQKAAVYPTNDV